MKKVWIFLLLFLAVLAGAGMYLLPSIRGAAFLQKNLETRRFTYRLEAELDREKLTEDQRRLLDSLADMTGLEKDAMYDLTLEGNVTENLLYILIYPAGCREPLLELYLGEEDVLNGALLYNAVRNRYTRQNRLLDAIFPVWDNHVYVSLEQLEQLFEVDLSGLRDFEWEPAREKLSFQEAFVPLVFMSREKDGNDSIFEKSMEGAEAELILHDTAEPYVEVKLSADRPAEILEKLMPLLDGREVSLSDEMTRTVEKITAEICFGQGGELTMPEDLVNPQTIDAIVSLKAILQEMISVVQ